jgi:hypothetical protein
VNSPHKKSNGRNAENKPEEVVFFQNMIVTSVVRLMPTPQKAMHYIFVCPPGHKFPEQKCADGDERANKQKEKTEFHWWRKLITMPKLHP